MRLTNVVLLIFIFAVSQLSLADEGASEPAVKYVGYSSAKNVCIAVVKNDAERLQQLLNIERRSMLHGYEFKSVGPRVAGSFSCNNMALLDFAKSVGANEVSSYLASGRVAPETQVAATSR